jgi:hypothetical protein
MTTLSWMFDEQGNHLPASTPQFTPGCAGIMEKLWCNVPEPSPPAQAAGQAPQMQRWNMA